MVRNIEKKHTKEVKENKNRNVPEWVYYEQQGFQVNVQRSKLSPNRTTPYWKR
jgi:hypothetical protein